MRIAQIILPGASEYERKSQRVDRQALTAASHEVVTVPAGNAASSGAGVAHVYATGELPPSLFRRFPLPYVASADMRKPRWPFRGAVAPDYVVSPIPERAEQSRNQPLAEAVEDVYFTARISGRPSPERRTAGSFARPSVRNMIEQTSARIQRFRDDVTWKLFESAPSPEDLAGVDIWVDPTVDDLDFDGFVAEAYVVGLPVVASRTPINVARLERGRTGFLVPPRDPNELTHAILTALFKREAAEGKQLAANQTAAKFRPRHRVRALVHMYETLIS